MSLSKFCFGWSITTLTERVGRTPRGTAVGDRRSAEAPSTSGSIFMRKESLQARFGALRVPKSSCGRCELARGTCACRNVHCHSFMAAEWPVDGCRQRSSLQRPRPDPDFDLPRRCPGSHRHGKINYQISQLRSHSQPHMNSPVGRGSGTPNPGPRWPLPGLSSHAAKLVGPRLVPRCMRVYSRFDGAQSGDEVIVGDRPRLRRPLGAA